MQVYFSHSYRNVPINSYFLEHFLGEDITLWADQKSDTWCVAKLERYLSELSGFISIIPRRNEADSLTYSPYIGHELTLARRSRLPRLLFVDDQVLRRFHDHFPKDAVPFSSDVPQRDTRLHSGAIRAFKTKLLEGGRVHQATPRQATLIVASQSETLRAADSVADLLRSNYDVSSLTGDQIGDAFDNIDLLEQLLASEVCVFLLGQQISYADLSLAMAHAHCIPSVRFRFDPDAKDTEPALSGLIRWNNEGDLMKAWSRQLENFRIGFVQPVQMARASSAETAIRSVATMQWTPDESNYWNPADGRALVAHVTPDYPFVQDQVSRVAHQLGRNLGADRGRAGSFQICEYLYREIRRLGFSYSFEPPSASVDRQVIRSPSQIQFHKTVTCLDMACLFAALLEAAFQQPIIVVLDGERFAHALVGFRALDEPSWERPGIGDLRRSLDNGDLVLFEPTGAVASDDPVGAETREQRLAGEKTLDFQAARDAAHTLLRGDVRIRHVVDTHVLRSSAP